MKIRATSWCLAGIGLASIMALGESDPVTRDVFDIRGVHLGTGALRFRSAKPSSPKQVSLHGDVCVVGGGSGGIGAAVAAARAGANVILIEREPQLGGTSTQGYVSIWSRGPGCAISREIYTRLALHANGVNCSSYDKTLTRHSGRNMPFQPEIFLKVVTEMLNETGRCRILLKTSFIAATVDEQVKRVISVRAISDDGADYQVNAHVFIDCTGDGLVCQASGCEVMLGAEPQSRFNEPSAPLEPKNVLNALELIYRIRQSPEPAVQPLPEGIKPRWRIGKVSCCADTIPGSTVTTINPCGLIAGWTLIEIGYEATFAEAKRQAQAHWHVLQHQRANDQFDSFAPMLAVRETYRIVGKYVLTENDVKTPFSMSPHPDLIAYADHPMDTHGSGGGLKPAAAPYGVPYRCLVPKGGLKNLLIACRGASFSHLAASSCRLQRTMVQLGHAAGLAAVQCISNHCDVEEVQVAAIQKQLDLPSQPRGVR